MNSPYHTVNIQNLEDKNPAHADIQSDKNEVLKFGLLSKELDSRQEKFVREHLYYGNSTCEHNTRTNLGFIGAYLFAYQNHRDVILSPDDFWNMIMIMFSKHVNENAEALRTQFVSHEGQKKLTVTEYTDSVERSLEMEREWESGFFTEMMDQIRKNTKEGVADNLKADFTTTTPFEEIFSIATVMDSFQQYFKYGRCIACCGINNVHFMGTLEDWNKLHDKTTNLAQYSLAEGDKWSIYVEKVLVILKQFIQTYEGAVDVSFWNNIFQSESVRVGSGGDVDQYITGWFLHLIGVYKRTELSDLPTHSISVPIELENKLTATKKNLTLLGGFTGVHHNGQGAYRPQLSMALYHFQREKLQQRRFL